MSKSHAESNVLSITFNHSPSSRIKTQSDQTCSSRQVWSRSHRFTEPLAQDRRGEPERRGMWIPASVYADDGLVFTKTNVLLLLQDV